MLSKSLQILSFFLLFSTAELWADTLVINSGGTPPLISSDDRGFYNLIIKEIFRRLGQPVRTIQLPAERSLINVNKGIDDGTIARIAGLEKKYPNLIRVPESVLLYDFVAYAHPDFQHQVNHWDDLNSYVVGFLQGWKIYEKNVKAKLITKVEKPEQLFRLIENRRADLVLFEWHQGQWWLRKLNIQAKLLTPPLAQKEMYIYMNKKHHALAKVIGKTVVAMKKDGTYQRLLDSTLLK